MANVSEDLLKILRCPVTGAALKEKHNQLLSTLADSNGVVPRYDIDEGIPLLLRPDQMNAS